MLKMRWISTTAALGLVLLAAACSGGDSGGPSGGISGTYQLVKVDGDALPESEEMNWGTANFTSGSLKLWDDGAWDLSFSYDRLEIGDSRVLEDFGGYDRDGGDVHFSSEEFGDEFWGMRDGNSITLTYDFDGDGYQETEFTFAK
ncbi:MAG: hypothetical protein ACREMH_02120 [Gemmatimonadales bacterium]